MDYRNWTERTIAVGNLLLDPNNPRIPPEEAELIQTELIAELVKHDDVYDLAKNIAENGYFPIESLIACKKKGKIYVIEGNRRLAACKLLLNHDLAPKGNITKFQTLASQFDIHTIRKLKVIIAPNREAASPIIVSRHTNVQIKSWHTIMQATYYYNLYKDSKLSFEDFAVKCNLTIGKLASHIALYKMYSIACSFKYPPEVEEVVKNPRKFYATNLQRIYESEPGKKFLGISIGLEGEIEGHINSKEFTKGFSKIVSDVADKKTFTSRTFNTSKDISGYLDRIDQSEKPDTSKEGTFDDKTFLPKEEKEKKKKRKTAPKPRKPKGLIPTDFERTLENPRIELIVGELQKISPGGLPNATVFLFRVLLELGVSVHLKKIGELKKIRKNEQEKRAEKGGKLEKGWSPSLSEMISWIIFHPDIINDGKITKVLERAVHVHQHLLDINLFIHNEHAPSPDGDIVRKIWTSFEAFMQFILTEPEVD